MIGASDYKNRLDKWLYDNEGNLQNKEQEIYNNTSSYLNKAVQELKKINCQCTDDDYCDRCCLLDEVRSVLFDINKMIL